jgi:CBS domain-containing protein
VGADGSVEETLRTMIDHGVRRPPVIRDHELVGVAN